MAGGGLRYEAGRDMPPGMQELAAVKIAKQLTGTVPSDAPAPVAGSRVYNMDCMEGMKQYPDEYFDLAIVDPVYGDVPGGGYMSKTGGGKAKHIDYDDTLWKQKKTPPKYFEELFRVSKNQVIWGANYFMAEIGRASSGWIIWDKCRPEGTSYSECEIAYTSFHVATHIFRYRWNGFIQQNMKSREVRIHPTQKPTDLYRWIYETFRIPAGSKILDTHLGSGTHRIAAFEYGMDFTGYEIHRRYFEDQEIAWAQYTAQTRMEGFV